VEGPHGEAEDEVQHVDVSHWRMSATPFLLCCKQILNHFSQFVFRIFAGTLLKIEDTQYQPRAFMYKWSMNARITLTIRSSTVRTRYTLTRVSYNTILRHPVRVPF